MFSIFSKNGTPVTYPDLKLFNTESRTLETFTPRDHKRVTMYSCGPTVYDYAHIGNLRAYVFVDILKRTLTLNGYHVKNTINLTDFGHLTDDGDAGEDDGFADAYLLLAASWAASVYLASKAVQLPPEAGDDARVFRFTPTTKAHFRADAKEHGQ